ncbi:hypothetical protein I302_103225 [Kwoniella bestiolae CBS 10118]|uniref:Sister chromatid cohesion protein n=1 Tax=Kwoniella bestiolae CBS 10118 TaxID=1296100 RepID=A0A1B9G7T7_9TREE|nr:hypothetical protein I302_01924 [Kwoniella bestiolae CBS 10118]OCF27089.1 hypothetical protein I302_01924 [Kwoniella bestiolae CBS 10118]
MSHPPHPHQQPLSQGYNNGYNHTQQSSASSSSSNGHSQHHQQHQPHRTYDDPSNLLSVYPFMTYAPTARVAQHLSPHTTTYPPTPSSSDLYPQYSQILNRLGNPTTIEDWAMRQAAEARLREILSDTRGNSYSQLSTSHTPQSYQPSTPTSSNSYPGPSSQPYPIPYTFLPPYSSQPTSNGQLQTPISANGYSPISPQQQTPAFQNSPQEYFETFVNTTLARPDPRAQAQSQTQSPPVSALSRSQPLVAPQPVSMDAVPAQAGPSRERRTSPRRSTPTLPTISTAQQAGPSVERRQSPSTFPASMTNMRSPNPLSSVASTPIHERIMQSSPVSSPDPLGPSPTKKSRNNNNGYTDRSRSRDISPSLAGRKITPDMELGSLSMRDQRSSSEETPKAKGHRKIVEVVIPTRKKVRPDDQAISDDEEEEDDEGLDWGEDKDGDWNMDDGRYRSPPTGRAVLPKGSGRTGERDMRSSWQKLVNLLEDIFEESDTFPSNPTSGDLAGSRFFSTTTKDGSVPLLSFQAIKKVSSYVTRVQSARKRQSSGNADAGVGQWDPEVMGNILRLLERNMRDMENLTVFLEDRKPTTQTGEGKKKSASKKKKDTPDPSGDDIEELGLSEDALEKHESILGRVRDGVGAAECVLVLLDSEGLSKQMYSEDLLTTSVSVVKEQMEKVMFPIVEGLAGEKISSNYLAHIVQAETASSKKGKAKALSPYFSHPSLSAIAASIISSIPRLTSMISKPQLAFSDSLIIQTVYLAIGPLFINEPMLKRGKKDATGKEGGGVMKGLKMEALGCLRGAFARYEDQRQWIVEEILSSLVRIPEQNHVQNKFELANGKSIHTISALLLQLIQASAYGTIDRVRKLHSSAAEAEMMGVSDKRVNVQEEETRICADTIESALRSARIVAGYLVQKSTTTKATKTSHDTEYKAILDLFLKDLMLVLYRPEWPAASLYLTIFSRILIVSLEDQRNGPESTAAKGIALDYLGDIAARLKGSGLEMTGEGKIATLDEVIANVDVSGLNKLIKAQEAIMTFLSSAANEDGSLNSSRDMACMVWAQELQGAIKKSTSVVEKLASEKDEEAQESSQKLQSITTTLKNTLRNVWMGDEGLFEVHDPRQGEVATSASIAVSRGRQLQNAVDPILIALLGVLDNPVVALRSKALRGVGSVIVVDPEVLGLPQIRQALEDRLSDPSPAVRDAAVELVGKYIVQKPKLAAEYYPHIALRAMDTGLGVRKRVVKLLKGIFPNMEIRDIKVDICCKVIELTDDQDEGVKELAIKTFTELLYTSGEDAAGMLVDILGDFRGNNGLLERAMDGVSTECDSTNHKSRFGQTIDSLITRLIDATEETEFDSLSHVRAIWLLCRSDPGQIDTQKAGVLHSYLRAPTNSDDQATNELLLKIFRKCIPHMPKTASTFASDLTKKLMPMISKPAGGFQALRETIGCFCVVINCLTRDWGKLINVLRACEAKIRPIRSQFLNTGTTTAPSQAASMMLYITALLVEGCKLDNIAQEDDLVDLELRKITSSPISVYFYEVYLDFAKLPSFQSAATICIGSLFRSYPFLLQREETTEWMLDTFNSQNEDNRAQLLSVIHEFLASEVERRTEKGANTGKGKKGEKVEKKELGFEMLRGDAKELQDSDHSTTIVQNNIEQIFDCARSQNSNTQNAALDVLGFVVNQGLYSPVHTVPILVTLETSCDPQISERALSLHQVLHQKHASLVTVLYMESAKASYSYQRSLSSEPSGHRNGVALLQNWYNLLSEKRAWKIDFLKALARGFDRDLIGDLDPNFVLYLAENLATFEYKLQEEPMTIIVSLQKIISTCTNLISIMEKINLQQVPPQQLNDPIQGRSVKIDDGENAIKLDGLVNSSIIMSLAVGLKNHLLNLYHLPEDKCATHVPGKKSTIGDKPTQRRGAAVLDLSGIPYVRGVQTFGEFRELQSGFLRLIHEDGSLADLN